LILILIIQTKLFNTFAFS